MRYHRWLVTGVSVLAFGAEGGGIGCHADGLAGEPDRAADAAPRGDQRLDLLRRYGG